MADEQVKVSLTADASQYERALKSASKHTAAVDESMKKTQKTAGRAKADWSAMGAAITLAGGAAVIAMKKAVDAASHLSESTSKMKVIFGSTSKEIEKFGETSADALGLSKQEAYDAASAMGILGKAAGLTGKELAKFSTDMVGLAADLGSFFDSSTEEAMDAISSGLRGEAEPLRRYGVLLDDATLKNRAMEMGIISSVKNALTPQQKSLAAQAEILAQTSDAQGDFGRTSDGLAGSQKKMTAEIGNAQAALGEALLPVMSKGVGVVADLAGAFASLPGPVRDTVAGMGLLAAAAALIAPGAIKAAKGVRDISKALKEYTVVKKGADAASAAGGLKGIGAGAAAAAGPIAGLVAAVTALAFAANKLAQAQMDKQMSAMAAAMDMATISGKSLSTAIDFEVEAGFGHNIDKRITGIEELVSALHRGKAVADQLGPAFETIDLQLTKMSPEAAAAAYQDLADRLTATGGSVEDLNAHLPGYIGLTRDAARAAAEQGGAEGDKAAAIKEANDAQQKAIDLVTGYINAQMAAAGAADYLLGAQDRLTKAHKENGRALEGSSAKAIENRDAMRSEVGAVLANVDAKIENAKASGKTTVEAYEIGNAALAKGRAALEKSAVAAGYNKDEVKKLLDQYMKLPKDVKTQVTATGVTAAEDSVRAYKSMLDRIPSQMRTAFTATFTKVEKLQAANRATGGKITGPGTGTSDTAGLYALSNGEWVVPAAQAARYGDDFMDDLVSGDVAGFASGGKAGKKKPLTAKQKAAAAKKKRNAAAAKRKKAAQAAADARQAILDEISWQYEMDRITLPQKIAKEQARLRNLKPGGAESKDLQLQIHRDQKEAADALMQAAEKQQAVADQMSDALSLSSTQANGKKWTSAAMLGDFANRARQGKDFASLVSGLAKRGLSEDVINQVLAAGPVAGADMARALAQMSAGQLASVNANQSAINKSGQRLATNLATAAANAVNVNLSGGAPVVLQLDSRAVYEGQLKLKRQMGGSYALTG